MKNWLFALVGILIVSGAVIALVQFMKNPPQELSGVIVKTEAGVSQYTNEEYGFSLSIPDGWIVEEQLHTVSPMISFVKRSPAAAPLETYSDNITHISILPLGLSEGYLPPWQSTSNGSVTQYILSDGTAWALKSEVVEPHPQWKRWGFIWANVEVGDQEDRCMRNGQEVPLRECNALAGDEMIRTGTISPSDWAEIQSIISSFTFIPAE